MQTVSTLERHVAKTIKSPGDWRLGFASLETETAQPRGSR